MSRQMFRHVSRLYRSMSPLWFLSVHMLSLISINKQNPDMLAERRQKEIEAATVVNQVSLAVASHIIEWIDMANLQADLYLPLEQLIKVASPAFGHVPVPPSSLVASSSLPRPFSSVSSSSSSLPYSSELYSSARTLSSPIPSSSVPSSSSGPSSSSTIPCSSPIPSLCDTAFLAANRRYHVSRDEQLNCLPSLVPVLIPNSRTAVNIIFYNHLGRRYCRK